MNGGNLFQSRAFKRTVYVLAGLAVALLIFQAGVYVGYRKAAFSYRWGENYSRNFGGRPPGFPPPPMGHEYMEAHGTSGSVIKVEGDDIVIKDDDDVEKTVVTNAGTVIRRRAQTLKISDLKVGDSVVVIGSPDDQGRITANFIRVF